MQKNTRKSKKLQETIQLLKNIAMKKGLYEDIVRFTHNIILPLCVKSAWHINLCMAQSSQSWSIDLNTIHISVSTSLHFGAFFS